MSWCVNVSRDIWTDEAFKKEPLTEREAFIWIIMEAAWKGREKRIGSVIVELERGQAAASVRFMAEAWGWTKSSVHRFLERLKKRDMIGTDTGTGVCVITVRKYDQYQLSPKDGGTPSKRKAGQQRDSSGTNENTGNTLKKGETNVSPADVLAQVVSIEAAEDFIAFRKELRKPVTARSARAMVKKLSGHPDPEAVLSASVANGWQGIFPEKVKPALRVVNGGSHDRRQFDAAHREYARRIGSGEIDRGPDPSDPFAGR